MWNLHTKSKFKTLKVAAEVRLLLLREEVFIIVSKLIVCSGRARVSGYAYKVLF